MHHFSGVFGFLIGWRMTKNHFRFVLKERSLKCMLCSKCNGRLHLTFSGQKGRRICRPWGIPSHHPQKPEWAGNRNIKKSNFASSNLRSGALAPKVNEHFSIVSGDCPLHDDSYGCFAVANASIDREIWTNKGDLARVTKYGNILMVLLGVATMNNLE